MTFRFLCEQFQSLSAAGKMAVIAGYILVILLIMLWAMFPIRKRKAKTLPTNMAYLVPQPTQEAKNYRHNSEESQNLYKPEKSDVIGSGVYSKLPNNFGNRHIHYHTNNKRQDSKNNSLQRIVALTRAAIPSFSQSHIDNILNRLTRRVNQSRKAPPSKKPLIPRQTSSID